MIISPRLEVVGDDEGEVARFGDEVDGGDDGRGESTDFVASSAYESIFRC